MAQRARERMTEKYRKRDIERALTNNLNGSATTILTVQIKSQQGGESVHAKPSGYAAVYSFP